MHYGCLIETNDFGDDIILESINKSNDAHPDTISVRVVWNELNIIILIFLKTKPMRYNLLRWTFSSQPGFTDTVPGTHKFPLHVRIRLFKAKWFVNTLRHLMFFFIYHLFIYAFMYARWSYRDGLLSSSHFAWSSIAQSICQRTVCWRFGSRDPGSNPAFSIGRQLVSFRLENRLPVPEHRN